MKNFTRNLIVTLAGLMLTYACYSQQAFLLPKVGIGNANPLSKFEVNGSFGLTTTAINSSASLDATYATILATPASAYTITLPLASGAKLRVYTIVYNGTAGGNIITIKASGSDLIYADANSVTSYLLIGGAVSIQSDGTNWHITVASPPVDGVAGGVFYGTGIGSAFSPAGVAGQVLQSNGASAPTWVTTTGGTVTSFSSGNLSPLFSTSVATASTTPALSFALSNAAAYTILGNNTNASAVPAYFAPALASALFANQGTTTTLLHGNAAGNPAWGKIATADIGASQVTYAKVQNVSANVLLGNPTGSAAAPSEIGLGTGFSFSGSTLNFTPATSGTVTTISATAPLSVANPTTTPAILLSGTAGGVFYGTGVGTGSFYTGAGTAGQLLQSNGSGAPSWVISAVNNWAITGNSSVAYASNFIGTASGTNQGLKLEVNGITSGRIEDINITNGSYGNTSLGYLALNAATTAYSNVAIGKEALENNTANGNVAVGDSALATNTIGIENTAVGNQSMVTNLSGIDNTAMGYAAMQANTLGNRNTAIGDSALNSSNTGSNNTAVGYNALNNNSSTGGNTAVGANALNRSTTGTGNTAMGYNALNRSPNSSNNTAIGAAAMSASTTGGDNVALGSAALQSNTGGKGNVVIGSQAMSNNSGGGDYNVAVGMNSLFSNSGTSNTAIGYNAQYLNITGNRNISLGDSSLYSNLSSSNNTGIGYYSLYNTTSANNTAVGDSSLKTNTTGTNNTAIGYDADVASNNLTNATAIGANAIATASNLVVLGNNASIQFSLALMPGGNAGLSGQVLQSNGAGFAPTWATVSGTGTVTSFSAGNLSPLFTSSVATATTTPALLFTLTPTSAYTILGNNTGSSAAPAYFSPTLNSALFANQGTTTTVLHGNAGGNPSWSQIGLTTDVAGTLPIVNGGTGATTFTTDGILYGNGTSAVAATTAGTTGQVLTNSSGTPKWEALGGVASITSAVGPLSIPETTIINYTVPANALAAGTTFRLRASGTSTSTVANAAAFRVRIGTTGTNADPVAAVVTTTAGTTGTNVPFNIDELVTIQSTGSSGTALGSAVLNCDQATAVSAKVTNVGQVTTAITINTTVSNIIQLSFISAANTTTCTFYNAEIEVVKP